MVVAVSRWSGRCLTPDLIGYSCNNDPERVSRVTYTLPAYLASISRLERILKTYDGFLMRRLMINASIQSLR